MGIPLKPRAQARVLPRRRISPSDHIRERVFAPPEIPSSQDQDYQRQYQPAAHPEWINSLPQKTGSEPRDQTVQRIEQQTRVPRVRQIHRRRQEQPQLQGVMQPV